MSTTAVYYPNVTIVTPRFANRSQDYDKTDINLLKTAALLWDDLEVIVPYSGFDVQPEIHEKQKPQEKWIREAFNMFVKPRSLLDTEKQKLLTDLKKLIENGIPSELQYEVKIDNYNMYPEKLSQGIWRYLTDAGLVKNWGGYYGIKRDFGLVLMGMIADICAGGTRRKVTNYPDAHSAYTRLVASQSEIVTDFEPNTGESYTTLASISMNSVNAGAFTLERLVKARQREKEDDVLPPLRRNYRAALDRYVARIKTEARSESDVKQIESEFKKEMEIDFNNLRELLQLQLIIPLLTVGFTALAAFSGQPLGVAAALGVGLPTYRLRKNEALQKSVSGWLHKA